MPMPLVSNLSGDGCRNCFGDFVQRSDRGNTICNDFKNFPFYINPLSAVHVAFSRNIV